MPYLPVQTSSSQAANYNQINKMIAQLNNEQTVKTFKQAGGKNAIINGRLPYEGGYGSLYYDANGIPSIVLGILPDGTMGMVVAKAGEDVLGLFS